MAVNNGFRAYVEFPFGWRGQVGVLELDDQTVQLAYPSPLAPPVGFLMTLGLRLLVVRQVRTPDERTRMTVLTLTPPTPEEVLEA